MNTAKTLVATLVEDYSPTLEADLRLLGFYPTATGLQLQVTTKDLVATVTAAVSDDQSEAPTEDEPTSLSVLFTESARPFELLCDGTFTAVQVKALVAAVKSQLLAGVDVDAVATAATARGLGTGSIAMFSAASELINFVQALVPGDDQTA